MFCRLGEEKRTRFRKKKEKEKTLSRPKWDERVCKDHVKYVLPYLKPFLNKTAFYAKLSGRFSDFLCQTFRTSDFLDDFLDFPDDFLKSK